MKNRVVQILLSLALLALLIQIVLIAPSQIRDAETKASIMPVPEVTPVGKEADQSMKEMHMIETQEGRKEWELWADKAESMKNEVLIMANVKTIFFSDKGVTFTVTGKKGTVQTKSKDMRVEGDVITRSSNGYTFRTEVMVYNSAKRTLNSTHPVEMLGPSDSRGQSLKLDGVGMNADMNKSSMDILSDVKAEKGLEDGRKVFIRSHRANFSGIGRTADFLGEVVLDMDNMRITGPQARFNYDSKRDLVKSVMFSGGTRVSDPEKWATAQSVDVDFDADKFVFRGSPRVVQNNDELRGEVITFLQGGKQVEVTGARAKVDEKRLEQSP